MSSSQEKKTIAYFLFGFFLSWSHLVVHHRIVILKTGLRVIAETFASNYNCRNHFLAPKLLLV